MTNNQLIVEAIQRGLNDSYTERRQAALLYNNHLWVANYNFIFSSLEKLDGRNGLHVRSFSRGSYKMACIYDETVNTLYTICGANKFKQLRSRKYISKFHYTDGYCLLSSHDGFYQQQNMFGEDVIIETQESLENLLKSITVNFSNEFDINEYCILSCEFNHRACEIYSITANFMSRNYQVIKEDKSWNSYITPCYNLLDENEQESVAEDSSVSVQIKENVKIKLKDRNSVAENKNS